MDKLQPAPKKAPVVEKPKAAPDVMETPLSSPPPGPAVAHTSMAGTSPCDWDIKPLGGDRIMAIHEHTRVSFQGTIKEFNDALRG